MNRGRSVRVVALVAVALAGCHGNQATHTQSTGGGDPSEDRARIPEVDTGEDPVVDGPVDDSGVPGPDAPADLAVDGPVDDATQPGSVTCKPCLGASDCGPGAFCVQYAGSDYCGASCSDAACAGGETCIVTLDGDGNEVSACVPSNGTCAGEGCNECPGGTTCEITTGTCRPNAGDESSTDAGSDAGTCTPTALPPDTSACCSACTQGNAGCQANGCYNGWWCDPDTCRCQSGPGACAEDAGTTDTGGTCDPYVLPDSASCCSSCSPGDAGCQSNGCYGGWWCNADTCRCHAPLASCGSTETDAGAGDTASDGGEEPPTGTVDAHGGTVSRLYFAVVGDTRPALKNDTANYPTAIIDRIYQDVEAMSPRPQFVITTGDYVYASSTGSIASDQLQLYRDAMGGYSGTVFPAMGNHECTGYTDSNCAGSGATGSYQAYLDTLLSPIGRSLPYYSLAINGQNGDWTAKLVVVACNAWDATQRTWLENALAQPTTYTFVVNHERLGTTAPCDGDLTSILDSATYNMFIVGHTHTYSHSGRQLIEGVGGAPITGSANYGWATVEQLSTGGFRVTQYDYDTARPVDTFTVE